jgi:hypothetical protein
VLDACPGRIVAAVCLDFDRRRKKNAMGFVCRWGALWFASRRQFWCGNAHGSGDSPIPEQILGEATAGERKEVRNQLMEDVLKVRYLLAITSVLICQSSFAAPARDTLFIKNGDVVVSPITSIDPWAVYLSDHSLVSLKVINFISTEDDSIVTLLRSFYPEARISTRDSRYLISLADVHLQPAVAANHHVLQNFSVAAFYTSVRGEDAEVQLICAPSGAKGFLAQFAVAAGFAVQPNTSEYSFGIGYEKQSGQFTYSAFLNAGERFSNRQVNGDHSSVTAAFSAYSKMNIFTEGLSAMVGGRYYFKSLDVQGEFAPFAFMLGLSMDFKTQE